MALADRLPKWKARAIDLFVTYQQYGALILLAWFATKFPVSAFIILAMMHWTALDALRRNERRPIEIDLFLVKAVKSVEEKHRFCGDDMSVTNRQVYRVGARHYLVEVSRTERDLEGNEIA